MFLYFFPPIKLKRVVLEARIAKQTSRECHVIPNDVTGWRKMRGRGISEVEGNKVNIVITVMFSPLPTPSSPCAGCGVAYTGILGDLHGITRDKGGGRGEGEE